MSTDLYTAANFTAGQEIREGDLNNLQKFLSARLSDQLFERLTPGLLVTAGDPDQPGQVGANANTKWAYCLTPGGGAPWADVNGADGKVWLKAGTVFQKIGNSAGTDSTFLPYTFDGTENVTVAAGHATLPRVDILQMKLEYETGGAESRVTETEAEYATIDFGAHTTHFDSVLRTKFKGFSGNSIQVRTVAGGALALSEVGAFVTITYVTSVTTVAAIEALITASSTILEVDTPGTAANVLVTPGDTLGYTALTGGVDTVLSSSSVNMTRRVKCTLSVVTGVPTAAPAPFPAITSGYVPLAAFVVHPVWAVADGIHTIDHPTATAIVTLMDLRMPLGVKKHLVHAKALVGTDEWVLEPNSQRYVTDTAGSGDDLIAICDAPLGRLVGVGIASNECNTGAAAEAHVCWWLGYGNREDMVDVSALLTLDATPLLSLSKYTSLDVLEGTATTEAEAAVGNGTYGLPLWTNGRRAVDNLLGSSSPAGEVTTDTMLCLRVNAGAVDAKVYRVIFYVAEGV